MTALEGITAISRTVQQLDRLTGPHVLASSAGDQFAQHGAYSAHHLGAQPAQIVAAARPDRITIVWTSAANSGRSCAQRSDRDRAGGVVVVDLTGVQ